MEKVFIGIDISKKTLDFFVKSTFSEKHFQIENNVKAIDQLIKKVIKEREVVIAMENTGRYNCNLFEYLSNKDFKIYVLNPLHLKKSMGLSRGKNDKIDSQRICLFIEKNYADLKQWKPSTKTIDKLDILYTERRYRTKIKTSLLTQQKDYKMLKNNLDKDLIRYNQQLIKLLEKQIKLLDHKIEYFITLDSDLKEHFERIQTIPGVGKVLATLVLVKTKGFTEINSPRKMACYAGVVPFENKSGSSIFGRNRVSIFADKELKKILHLATLSTIRLKNDLAIYYRRKIDEGKNKMSVINAIRNKIIHRIYALIKNQTIYKNNLVLS